MILRARACIALSSNYVWHIWLRWVLESIFVYVTNSNRMDLSFVLFLSNIFSNQSFTTQLNSLFVGFLELYNAGTAHFYRKKKLSPTRWMWTSVLLLSDYYRKFVYDDFNFLYSNYYDLNHKWCRWNRLNSIDLLSHKSIARIHHER